MVVLFEEAQWWGGDWITLKGINVEDSIGLPKCPYDYQRGMDVRLSDIIITVDIGS
jgi:hypothetical protein